MPFPPLAIAIGFAELFLSWFLSILHASIFWIAVAGGFWTCVCGLLLGVDLVLLVFTNPELYFDVAFVLNEATYGSL